MSVSDAARGLAVPPATGRSHIRLHALLGDSPWKCHYCLKTLNCPCMTGEDGNTFWRNRANAGATADHIIPITRGGTDSADNIVPSCMECNSGKNDRTWPDEWVPNLSEATFVYGAEVVPLWGTDSLATLGVLVVLASLERGHRYSLFDVADRSTDGHAVIRTTLSRLARAGRLTWRVVPGVERPFEHEFFDAAMEVSA